MCCINRPEMDRNGKFMVGFCHRVYHTTFVQALAKIIQAALGAVSLGGASGAAALVDIEPCDKQGEDDTSMLSIKNQIIYKATNKYKQYLTYRQSNIAMVKHHLNPP